MLFLELKSSLYSVMMHLDATHILMNVCNLSQASPDEKYFTKCQ